MTGPPVIRVEALKVCHGGKAVLEVPHLAVDKGEVLALIGPNGAGKSTLLQVLGLLQEPSQGSVFFEGEEVTSSSDRLALRRRLALAFQEPLLFRGTVFDNVALGLRLRGLPKVEVKQRTERWLSRLRISHLAGRSVAGLSVGEAQRVNLARSLALDPDVFLLDEPFAALDPPTQASMVEECRNILAETGTTTVFVTHSRNEALMLADRLAVMIDGRIAQVDVPERVFSSPGNEGIAAFLGIETMIRGRVLSTADGYSRVTMGQHQILVAGTYPPGEELLCFVRPEDIRLSLPNPCDDPRCEANVIRGTITRVTPLETQFKFVVDCSVPLTVLVSRQAFIEMSHARGRQVLLAFNPSAVQVIEKRLPTD